MPMHRSRVQNQITTWLAGLLLTTACPSAALAQGNNNGPGGTYQQLDQMLDQAFPGSQPAASSQYGRQLQQPMPISTHPLLNQGNTPWTQGSPLQRFDQNQNGSLNQYQNQQPATTLTPPASPLRRALRFLGGTQQQPVQPPQKFSLFKTMFGDGSSSGTDDATGNASRAQTQAGVAHNAYLRSCYGDHYSRCQAADEAYYAAESARQEADNAYYKMQSSANARYNYATARAASDAAQADADRARGNADSNY
jgi:hypothetical protein